MYDLISREAVYIANEHLKPCSPEDVEDMISCIPSARQWIPCSERLPKINQIVLLSTNSNNVYVGYRNKPELLWQVEEDGRKQWVYDPESYDVDIDVLPKTEDIDFYCEGVNDGGFLSITSANYNDRFEGVTAWMSLPEPYREVSEGRKENR